jgi:serine/threonine protein kinase
MSDATPRPSADRNLLFGILALQMDFITRDQLIAAMHTWVLDKAKPLGQILQEQGALPGDERVVLDALVDKHLRRHSNEAEKSLGALTTPAALREDLRQLADPDLDASLGHLAAAHGADEDPRGTVDHVGASGIPATMRFRILRPHARGGLGEVFVAEDTELRREVALKEIRATRADDAESRGRFLREAEINGRLEHPNIVPVYGLGRHADGRPFYAMRLVQGMSLKEAIRTLHEGVDSPRPGEPNLRLRQLLTRFVAVCNAVAYAHSRGVIHRDIKPANVMLGRFGETLLVDWGLAKVVGRKDDKPDDMEPTLQPWPGDTPDTVAGTALGTPAYMSPEQAAGRLDLVSPASDVYGLGATLYCLLTGQPPFQEQDQGRLLQQVSKGQWLAPRHVRKNVPTALDAICRKAMAFRAWDRYPTALDLAADVERWLADEPVSAHREPLRQRLARWHRRHRAPVAFAAALLLATCAFGLWLKQDSDARAMDAERAALGQLEEFDRLLTEDRLADAKPALQRAGDRLGGHGSDQTRWRLKQSQSDLDMVTKLEELLLQRLQWTASSGGYAAYADAFRDYGLDMRGLDESEVARRIQTSAIRTQLVAFLYHWTSDISNKDRAAFEKIWKVIWLAETDPWRRGVLVLAQRQDRLGLEQLVEKAEALSQPPAALVMLGRVLVAHRAARERLLRQAQRRYPESFWLNHDLAECLWGKEEGIGYARAALALRPHSPGAHLGLANSLLFFPGKLSEAESVVRRAIELKPDLWATHSTLGFILTAQNRFGEALACVKKALETGTTVPNLQVMLFSIVKALEELQAREQRLLAVLRGEVKPANAAEQISLAQLCQRKQLHVAAAQFYAGAFAEQQDLQAVHGYSAARAAIRVGLGKGDEATKIPDRERARWRQQALAWFKQDLALWGKRPPGERSKSPWSSQLAIQQAFRAEIDAKLAPQKQAASLKAREDVTSGQDWQLTSWQTEPELVGVRDEAALTTLPRVEREGWRSLWDEAAVFLAQAGTGK